MSEKERVSLLGQQKAKPIIVSSSSELGEGSYCKKTWLFIV
jgi:hypothetical protein